MQYPLLPYFYSFRLFLFFSLFFYFLQIKTSQIFAQKNLSDWKEIEKHQRFVMNQIEKKEYFLNEYKVNANRFALHQPIFFQYFERYFYTFDQRNASKNTLLKAIISRREHNKINFYREYVLDNEGNLIYYYEQEQPETASLATKKLKIYFFNQKNIKIIKNDKEVSALPEKEIAEKLANFELLKAKFKQ